MSERLVSKVKVRKRGSNWVMDFRTHRTRKSFAFGGSYILDTDEQEYSVPFDSWDEAIKRAGFVLINLKA